MAIHLFGKLNKTQEKQIEENIKNITTQIGYGLKYISLDNLDDITKMSLVEKRLISPEFAMAEKKAILINSEENISIMINEEDHLRIQVFSSGFELQNLLNLALEVEEKIGKSLDYAYNKDYGFLTSCPTNVGTGLRASVLVHLPALTITQNISKILEAISNFGMEIRGIYGENSRASGNMYQISNKQTLNLSEKDIINNLNLIIQKIIEQERLARKIITKDSIALEDKLYRSYGILENCRKITTDEVANLISDVKLGTDLGIITKINDLKVNKMYLYTKPANLQKYTGEKLDAYQRDIKRAEVIKQIINEK